MPTITVAELQMNLGIKNERAARTGLAAFRGAAAGAKASADQLENSADKLGKTFEKSLNSSRFFFKQVLAGLTVNAIRDTFNAAQNAVSSLAQGIGALSAASLDNAATLDSNTRSLALYVRNSQELREEIAALRETAKKPGIDFQGAFGADIAFRRLDLSLNESRAVIEAFANQTASAAKGPQEFNGVILALTQSLTKGKLEQEELNQIQERGIDINNLLRRAFNTADPQAINKLGLPIKQVVLEIAKAEAALPRASGGFRNTIDNLNDSLRTMREVIGTGIIRALETLDATTTGVLTRLEELATQVGEVFQAIGKSGVLSEVANRLFAAFDQLTGGDFRGVLAQIAGTLLSAVANLPAAATALFAAFRSIGGYLSDVFNFLRETLFTGIRAIERLVSGKIEPLLNNVDRLFKAGGIDAKQIGLTDLFRDIHDNKTPDVRAGDLKDLVDFRKSLTGLDPAAQSAAIQKRLGESELLPKTLPFAERQGFQEALDRAIFSAQLQSKRDTLGLPSGGAPTFGGGFADAFGLLGKDSGGFGKAIFDALSPLQTQASDLIFGGGAPAVTKQAEAQTNLLGEIADHTKKTADELSLRRQSLGGGALSRLGVTAVEASGITYSVYQRTYTADQTRDARKSGGGFRPR